MVTFYILFELYSQGSDNKSTLSHVVAWCRIDNKSIPGPIIPKFVELFGAIRPLVYMLSNGVTIKKTSSEWSICTHRVEIPSLISIHYMLFPSTNDIGPLVTGYSWNIHLDRYTWNLLSTLLCSDAKQRSNRIAQLNDLTSGKQNDNTILMANKYQ